MEGYFNVMLWPKDTGNASCRRRSGATNRFVQITVTNHAPILPRQQFLTAPYAFQAGNVGGQTAAAVASAAVGFAAATKDNNANAIVKRDSLGNFRGGGDQRDVVRWGEAGR